MSLHMVNIRPGDIILCQDNGKWYSGYFETVIPDSDGDLHVAWDVDNYAPYGVKAQLVARSLATGGWIALPGPMREQQRR